MAVTHYDDLVFQTTRPNLTSVRWKKLTTVGTEIVQLTDWSTNGVVELAPANYVVRIPIEDTDPVPTWIVMDTGEDEPFVRVVRALEFAPGELVKKKSGGGVLSGRIAVSSLTPRNYLEVVQGEKKVITFIVEADGRFDHQYPELITVKIKDVKKNLVVKRETDPDNPIQRVAQELDVQVLRCTLLPEDTEDLVSGIVKIEISFDNQKAILSYAMKVLETVQ